MPLLFQRRFRQFVNGVWVNASFNKTSAANDDASEHASTDLHNNDGLPSSAIGRSFLRKKVVVPPLSSHYTHLDRLDNYLQRISSSRLSLLCAPAGYGKTSLLSYWIKQQKGEALNTAWLTLDIRDNDIIRLCSYLIESLSCVLDDDAKDRLYQLLSSDANRWNEVLSERLVVQLVASRHRCSDGKGVVQ